MNNEISVEGIGVACSYQFIASNTETDYKTSLQVSRSVQQVESLGRTKGL